MCREGKKRKEKHVNGCTQPPILDAAQIKIGVQHLHTEHCCSERQFFCQEKHLLALFSVCHRDEQPHSTHTSRDEPVSYVFLLEFHSFYTSGFYIEPAGNPLHPKNAVTFLHDSLQFASFCLHFYIPYVFLLKEEMRFVFI